MKKWSLKWTKMRPLNKEEVKKISNNLPGVYRFSYEEEGDHNRYVFYVDQSEDIKNTVLQHLLPTEENACIRYNLNTKKCFFKFAKIIREEVRNATVRQAYKKYEPSCNKKEPEGRDDISVNLV